MEIIMFTKIVRKIVYSRTYGMGHCYGDGGGGGTGHCY